MRAFAHDLFTYPLPEGQLDRFTMTVPVGYPDHRHAADVVHRQLTRHPECRKQVTVADRLIVTKRDIAEPDEVAQLTAALTRLNPAAEILDPQARDALEPLLAARHIGDATAHDLGSHATTRAEHSGDIATLALTLDRPIEWAPFAVWLSLLLHAHGENVLRFKELLDVAGWSAPVVLDGIHHLIHPPIHLAAWPAGPRLSRIVIIAQGLPMHRIERSLRDFLAKHAQNREPTVAALAQP